VLREVGDARSLDSKRGIRRAHDPDRERPRATYDGVTRAPKRVVGGSQTFGTKRDRMCERQVDGLAVWCLDARSG